MNGRPTNFWHQIFFRRHFFWRQSIYLGGKTPLLSHLKPSSLQQDSQILAASQGRGGATQGLQGMAVNLRTAPQRLRTDHQNLKGGFPKENLETIGMLGKGAVGFVTLVRDQCSKKLYALKAMSKGHIVHQRLKDVVRNEMSCIAILKSEFIVKLCWFHCNAKHIILIWQPNSNSECRENHEKSLFRNKNHQTGSETWFTYINYTRWMNSAISWLFLCIFSGWISEHGFACSSRQNCLRLHHFEICSFAHPDNFEIEFFRANE